MKFRSTIILLVLAVALGVWIKYFESKKPNTAETQRQAGNVLNFDREKLEGIVIENGDDRIELERKKGSWRLTASAGERAMFHHTSTRVDEVFTCWPPGPPEREA